MRKKGAFTLMEVTVTLLIIGVLAGIAVPAAVNSVVGGRGKASAHNLKVIEEAKRQFAIDHPWLTAVPSTNALEAYLKYGMPRPSHGSAEVYENVLDLTKVAESSVNGALGYEPRGVFAGANITANGYNDLGVASPVLSANPTEDISTGVASGNEVWINLGDYAVSSMLLLAPSAGGRVYATLTPSGTNAVVKSIVGPTNAMVSSGTVVDYQAVPDTGYTFGSWNNTATPNPLGPTGSFTFSNSTVTLLANFTADPSTTGRVWGVADPSKVGRSQPFTLTPGHSEQIDPSQFYWTLPAYGTVSSTTSVAQNGVPAQTFAPTVPADYYYIINGMGFDNVLSTNAVKLTVTNAPPSVAITAKPNAPVYAGTPFSLTATVTDSDDQDGTFSWNWTATDGSFSQSSPSSSTYQDANTRVLGVGGVPDQIQVNYSVTATDPYGAVSAPATASVTIIAPPPTPVISVSSTNVSVPEGTTRTFSVSLSSIPVANTTVRVSKLANGDPDLALALTNLVFPVDGWTTPGTVSVQALEDTDTANGTATLLLEADGLAPVTVLLTEADNDALLTVQPSNPAWGSAGTSGVVTRGQNTNITASPSSGFSFVNWTAVAGTATFGTATSAVTSVSITNNATVQANFVPTPSIIVTPTTLNVPEGTNAGFSVVLSSVPPSATTVSIATQAGGDPDLTLGATNLSFTTNNWSSARTVLVNAKQDNTDTNNGSATFTFSASGLASVSATANEVDNDFLLTVRSSNTNMGTVTGSGIVDPSLNYTITAAPKTGFSFLGWVVSSGTATVAVPGATNTTVRASNASTVTANFGETPVINIIALPTVTVPEGTNAPVNVSLSAQPLADVTLSVTKQSGGDLSLSSEQASLTFTPSNWSTPQALRIAAEEDNQDTQNGSAVFVLSSPDAAASLSITATEADNDAMLTPVSSNPAWGSVSGGGIFPKGSGGYVSATANPGYVFVNWTTTAPSTVASILQPSSPATPVVVTADAVVTANFRQAVSIIAVPQTFSVNEGATNSFTVTLSSQPSETTTVYVNRASGSDPDLNANAPTLTFTTSNWNVPKTVQVTANADSDTTNGTATFVLSAQTGGISPVNVTVSEVDAANLVTLTLVSGETRTNIYPGNRGGVFGGGKYAPGSTVSISAIPMTRFGHSTGYSFSRWTLTSGSAAIADPYSATTTVTLSGNATVTAEFTGGGLISYLDLSPLYYGNGQVVPDGEGLYGSSDLLIRDMFDGQTMNCGSCFTTTCSDSDPLCALLPGYPTTGLVVTVRGRSAAPDGNNSLPSGYNNIYTSSTDLGLAVVHAGLAQPGELVTIRVAPMGERQQMPSVTRNGMTSTFWHYTTAAIQISRYTGADYPPPLNPGIRIITSSDPVNEVSPTVVNIREWSTAPVYVKLSAPPTTNTMVTIWPTTPSHVEDDITAYYPANWGVYPRGTVQSLLFTPQNWAIPQSFILSSSADTDDVNGEVTFAISSPGLAHATVTAREIDPDVKLTVASANTNQGLIAMGGVSGQKSTWTVVVTTNTTTLIYAYPKTGYKFVDWQVTAGSLAMTNTTNATNRVKISVPTTVRANFAPQ